MEVFHISMQNVTFYNLTGNPAVLRQVNRVRILNNLRIEGPGSRAQLARRSGLDAKTITNIVNSLLDDTLVLCHDARANGRGRPSEKIDLNPDAAFSLGIDVGAQQVTGVLINFRGDVKAKWHKEFPTAKNRSFILNEVKAALKDLVTGLSKTSYKKVKGLGICIPGFLDRITGTVIKSVNIRGFDGFKIVEALKESCGIEVILEEASRATAIGEIWFGGTSDDDDFVCVDLGYGIGMAIVHKGRLYRGANEVSGEIGHTVVLINGTKCTCGKRGCLETVASGRALGQMSSALGLNLNDIKSDGARGIYEAALRGDRKAIKVVSKAGASIGTAIANAINLFDPGFVVLCGGLTNAGEMLLGPLRKAVEKHCIRPFDVSCMIKVTQLGELAGALGAAMLPLRHYFELDNVRF